MQRELQSVQYVYVDESGNPNLDLNKTGVSRFYVVAAVLADAHRKDDLIQKVDYIRTSYFGKGEIKSSGVGNNLERRRRILSDLVATGIRFCALVTDKSQIDPTSGLQYNLLFI